MIQPAFQSQSWTESSKLGLTVDAPWMVTPFSSLTPHVLLTPISRPTAHAKLHRKTLRSMIFSDRRRGVYKSNSHRGSRTCAHRGPQTGFEEIRARATFGVTSLPRSGLLARDNSRLAHRAYMSAWHCHESVPHLRNPIKQTGNLCPVLVSNLGCRWTKRCACRKQDANMTSSKTVLRLIEGR
jgi:hypothetical protein